MEQEQNSGQLTLAEIEKLTILERLQSFEGNKTKAAASLGVTIKTLYNKLHAYGLMVAKIQE